MKAKLKKSVGIRIESDEYAIIFDADTGGSFIIDPVAVFISERLDGNLTSKEIINEMKNYFKEVPENAEEFVNRYITSLINKNLAEIC